MHSWTTSRLSSSSKMTKRRGTPIRSPYIRRRRAHIAWKVPSHRPSARPPRRSSARRRISPAALLVKVTAKIRWGGTFRSRTRWAIR